MELSDYEINSAATKVIRSLDDVVGGQATSQGPGQLDSYYDTVGIHNIKKGGIKGKLARASLRPFDRAIKKLFQGYFEQRTIVDNYVRDVLFDQQQFMAKFQNESVTSESLKKIFDEKNFETQKLIDKFKKDLNAELVEIKGGKVTASNDEIEPQILDQRRYKAIDKLNIGSGTDIREDYLNVDHRAVEGVDVVADVHKLPFKQESLSEIFASHLAEHFIERDLKKILKYWYSLLKRKGSIRLIVPNIEDMAKRYASGDDVTWEQLRAVALGGQDYASDYHFNHFSVESMRGLIKEVLPEADFTVVSDSRKNGECYEMEVLITKL